MDPNVWQQILGLLKDAQRSGGPPGWDTPAAAAAAIAAAAAAAEAAEAAAAEALRPFKKSRTQEHCAADGEHTPAGSSAPVAGGHAGSSSADGSASEGHHFAAHSGSGMPIGLNLSDDQATPTTMQGRASLSASAAAAHPHGSPAYSHNNQQQQLQQHASPPHSHHQQQQSSYMRPPPPLMLDGQATPTTTTLTGHADSASPTFSTSQYAGGVPAALLAHGGAAAAAAAAAGVAAAAGLDASGLGVNTHLDAAQLEDESELSTQQRLVQVTMLDRLFDLTCTRFSIKDGVVAPRKFWPRVQHGSPLPIQMLLEVHDSSWDPNQYTAAALLQLGTAVRTNKAAAAAAAEGNPAGYAAIWAQYLHVKACHQAGGLPDPDAGSTTTYGPYPAILVPGQNTFGGLLRIRNIKHHGELKAPQSTPHVLVLREKVGADAIKLHIKLTKASDVYPGKKSSAMRLMSSSLMGSLMPPQPAAGAGAGAAASPEHTLGWDVVAQQTKSYARQPTPSAAIAAAATAAASTSSDSSGSRAAVMRAPRGRARAEAAAAAAAAAAGMGDGAPALSHADNADELLAQTLLDLSRS